MSSLGTHEEEYKPLYKGFAYHNLPQKQPGGDLHYEVYPDSQRLDLGDNKCVAVFKYRDHAEKWAQQMYGKFYQIKEV